MPATGQLPNGTTIGHHHERYDQDQKRHQQGSIRLLIHTLPFLHEHTDNITEENKHRHVQRPARKLEASHSHMPEAVEEKLDIPEGPG